MYVLPQVFKTKIYTYMKHLLAESAEARDVLSVT
jgi:hypothetical protein